MELMMGTVVIGEIDILGVVTCLNSWAEGEEKEGNRYCSDRGNAARMMTPSPRTDQSTIIGTSAYGYGLICGGGALVYQNVSELKGWNRWTIDGRR